MTMNNLCVWKDTQFSSGNQNKVLDSESYHAKQNRITLSIQHFFKQHIVKLWKSPTENAVMTTNFDG